MKINQKGFKVTFVEAELRKIIRPNLGRTLLNNVCKSKPEKHYMFANI